MNDFFLKALPALSILFFTGVNVQAQKKAAPIQNNFTQRIPSSLSPSAVSTDCDTLNNPIPANWNSNAYLYAANDPDDNAGGFENGTSYYDDKQKAAFFDASATGYSFITGTSIWFGAAATSNSSKTVAVHIYDYDESTKNPGNLIGSQDVTMQSITEDVAAKRYTVIVFPPGLAMPASKKFFVAVDISNLSWLNNKDSLAIYSNKDDDTKPSSTWEQQANGRWYQYDPGNPVTWGLQSSLYIFPYISINAAGCSTLPVTVISFTASKQQNNVALNWKVGQESNMDRYEIEKADNNNTFSVFEIVKATNEATEHSYSSTDLNVFGFTKASAVQYRLKQVNKDGTARYSTTLSVNAANSRVNKILFSNPFTGALKLIIDLPSPEEVGVDLYDMHGRLMADEKAKTYAGGSNVISLAASALLPSGIYILKIKAGTENFQYSLMKQ